MHSKGASTMKIIEETGVFRSTQCRQYEDEDGCYAPESEFERELE
jgi:hypothetical protein